MCMRACYIFHLMTFNWFQHILPLNVSSFIAQGPIGFQMQRAPCGLNFYFVIIFLGPSEKRFFICRSQDFKK
jgi:hypothetical protein